MWGAVAKAAADTATSLYNNQQSIHATNLANKQAYERAKEFAQNQIQWRVEDSRKAGIHPLAGLGANVSMGAPSVIPADNQLDLSSMGQNISNVIDRWQNADQRRAEEDKAAALEEERLQMQRDEHKARMAESMANVALKQAEANRILNPIKDTQLRNYVKSRAVYSQPRVPARPRVNQKFKELPPDGSEKRPYRDYDWFIDRRGNKYMTTSEKRAQATQNSWIGDIPFYLSEGFHDLYNGWKEVFR